MQAKLVYRQWAERLSLYQPSVSLFTKFTSFKMTIFMVRGAFKF